MKNKRNTIPGMAGFIAIIAMIGFSMTSCDFLTDLLHEHDYYTVWSYNETQHWRECECGDKIDVGNHQGNNLNNIACSICSHKHTYNNTWSYNATQHWRECSCGAKSSAANHAASSMSWSTNATQHWHSCATCSEKFDVANHSGDPCTSCYYIIDTSKALNGTWTQPIVEDYSYMEMKYNNGNYEYTLVGTDDDGKPTIIPEYKGTYTVNDGKITTTITHVYGQGLTGLFVFGFSFAIMFEDWEPLEAEWYTKDQIRARMDAATISSLYGEDEDPWTSAIEAIDALYGPQTQDYSIIGNTLTLTSKNDEGEVKTNTYTRK